MEYQYPKVADDLEISINMVKSPTFPLLEIC